jgi:hypothetical protein
LILAAGPSAAADIDVSASVNRTSAGVGEEILLTVVVSGGFQNLPSPKLSEMADFNVYPSGSSTNFSFVNGRITSSKTSRFVLVPKVEGNLTIPEIAVQYKGDDYLTKPILITVTAAPYAGAPSPQAPSGVSGGELLLKASLNKSVAYVNEQVTLTLRFYRRSTIVSSRLVPPATTGFWVEQLPGERNFYEVLNGLQYQVTEIAMALFPTTQGELEVGPAVWECAVRERVDPLRSDPFQLLRMGRTRNASVKSEALKVEVKPLPVSGRPDAFDGAVGRFEISSTVDKERVDAEEPLTLTVKLSGRGNIGAVGDLEMPDVPGFRSYDSGASTDLSKQNRIVQGSKSFSKVYIPSLPGEYTIPPVELAYFDPVEGRYAVASSKQIAIVVSAGESAPNAMAGPAAGGEIYSKDIRYIKTQVPSFAYAGDRLYRSRGFLLAQLLAPAMIIGAFLYRTLKDRRGADPAQVRARGARRGAQRRLARARGLANRGDNNAAWKELGAALRGYIADITNTSPQGLTMDETGESLRNLGIPDEAVKNAQSILERCDAASFAPRGETLETPGVELVSVTETLDTMDGARSKR